MAEPASDRDPKDRRGVSDLEHRHLLDRIRKVGRDFWAHIVAMRRQERGGR